MSNELKLLKTYDSEVDELIEQLLLPRDVQVNYIGYIKVVDADIAERASEMIYRLYIDLISYKAAYNLHVGG
jgi:hypothetical protein